MDVPVARPLTTWSPVIGPGGMPAVLTSTMLLMTEVFPASSVPVMAAEYSVSSFSPWTRIDCSDPKGAGGGSPTKGVAVSQSNEAALPDNDRLRIPNLVSPRN